MRWSTEQRARRDLVAFLSLHEGETGVGLGELYEQLARLHHWPDDYGAEAIRLVDALWYRDFRLAGRAALDLRERLDDQAVSGSSVKVLVGLLTMRALAILAEVHRVELKTFADAVRDSAESAWHGGWLPVFLAPSDGGS